MMLISDLRKLAEAATPGPWTIWVEQGFGDGVITADIQHSICMCGTDDGVIPTAADNARYIAALSPSVVLAMIDALEAAQAMREAGVDLSRRCIEPPYMSEKAAVNEMIGIFDGPLQRAFDAALAKLEEQC